MDYNFNHVLFETVLRSEKPITKDTINQGCVFKDIHNNKYCLYQDCLFQNIKTKETSKDHFDNFIKSIPSQTEYFKINFYYNNTNLYCCIKSETKFNEIIKKITNKQPLNMLFLSKQHTNEKIFYINYDKMSYVSYYLTSKTTYLFYKENIK